MNSGRKGQLWEENRRDGEEAMEGISKMARESRDGIQPVATDQRRQSGPCEKDNTDVQKWSASGGVQRPSILRLFGRGRSKIREQVDRLFPFSVLLSNMPHIGKESRLAGLASGPLQRTSKVFTDHGGGKDMS
jgi:hypothetical protein